MGIVDVRDVARAHLAAAFLADASGRNIVSGHETTILEVGQALRERFGDRLPLPNRAIPKSLLWLVAPAVGQSRRFVARNVGYPWRADTSKSRRELGMTYRPMKDSIEEMVEQMLEARAPSPSPDQCACSPDRGTRSKALGPRPQAADFALDRRS